MFNCVAAVITVLKDLIMLFFISHLSKTRKTNTLIIFVMFTIK